MKDELGEIVNMSMKIHGDESLNTVDTFKAIKERIVNDVNESNMFGPRLYPNDIIFEPLDSEIGAYKIVVSVPYYVNFKLKEKK